MTACETTERGVGLPADCRLPLFVYGNLKPEELGFDQVSGHVVDQSTGSVQGTLWERDGMPLLRLDGRFEVAGAILRFDAPAAYGNVGRFEPRSHYRWTDTVLASGERGNVLVATEQFNPDRGGGDVLREPWASARDPLFRYGLPAAASALRTDAAEVFAAAGSLEWARFYRVQSALMLLFSSLERIAFRVAADKGVTARINTLGRTAEFVASVNAVGFQNTGRALYRADAPGKRVPLNHPEQFGAWIYQLRNNLMHQGKSTHHEAELVRTAALDLHDVLRNYLLRRLPALGPAWFQADPDGESVGWAIKPLLEDLT